MQRQEIANQAKMEAQKNKMRQEQQLQYITHKNRVSKDQVRVQEQLAKQKIDEARRRKIAETR